MQIKLELNEALSEKLRERAKKLSLTATSAAKMLIAQQLEAGENKEIALVRTPTDERKFAQLTRFKQAKEDFLCRDLLDELRVFAILSGYPGASSIGVREIDILTRRWVDFCSRWNTGVSMLEARYGLKPGTKGGYDMYLGRNPSPDWDVFSTRSLKLAEDYEHLHVSKESERGQDLLCLIKTIIP